MRSLERTFLDPIREGQRQNAPKCRLLKVRQKGSTPSEKEQSTNQVTKSSPCMNASPPGQNHKNVGIHPLHAFLPLDAKLNWVHFSPLFVMHESSLQMQACASQINKEHYNMLEMRHRTRKIATYSVQASPTR
jgi:hypothetical protein